MAAYISVAATDTASPLHAAIHRWDYPLSREGLLLLDVIDVLGHTAVGNKWKNSKRPFRARGQRFGQTDLPREEAIEILRRNAGR